MSDVVIFDTSVLVDDLRTGCHQERIRSLSGLIRTSSVVLAVLWRGATVAPEREFLRILARNHPVLTPTENHWIESGQILGKIRATRGFAPNKLRDLHFEVLIALTVRSIGTRLITSNRVDFEMVHSYRKFRIEVW